MKGTDIGIAVLAVVVCALAYANTIHGEFVYDDRHQIVENSLIKHGGFIEKALVSHVWAYRGDWSEGNYWRPTFVAWLIVNYRLFGLNPVGWHVTNILLHGLVVVGVYFLLRRLRLGWELAAAITFLYAVHPVHVESVAWISGSPNMLAAAPLLGSLLLALGAAKTGSRLQWGAALGLFGVALLAKEIAIVFPLVVLAAVWIDLNEKRAAVRAALPFCAVAALYFVTRWALLGQVQTTWMIPLVFYATTAPAVFAFYVSQAVVPYGLAPVYPLEVVHFGNLGVGTFVLPCVVVALAGGIVYSLWKVSPHIRLGAFFFVLFLAPALNFASFPPEHLVHDRYLYLPVLGGLMVLVCGLSMILERHTSLSAPGAQRLCLTLAVIASAPLLAATVRYNTAWKSPEALWSWCAEKAPASSDCRAQHAQVLIERGRGAEARKLLDRALELRMDGFALLLRADLASDEGRLEDAERDFRLMLDKLGSRPDIYERLAIIYEKQERFDDGIHVLQEGREKIPDRYCHFTDKIAALLIRSGRTEQAREELEAVRDRVPLEIHDHSRMVLYTLGMLYLENGEIGSSLVALQDFVDLCGHCTAERVVAAREQAARILNRPFGL